MWGVSVDPPPDLQTFASACHSSGLWPVLVGESGTSDMLLCSPIILYDYPQIAPESPGDLFDATEIDEILSLRILTLTDEEKREMRTSDERARAILERTESLSPEHWSRLHGAVRSCSRSRRRPHERMGMATPGEQGAESVSSCSSPTARSSPSVCSRCVTSCFNSSTSLLPSTLPSTLRNVLMVRDR